MLYPLKNDIVNAAQNRQLIKDPFFKDATMVTSKSGRPAMFGGGFGQVFQLYKETEHWAFKVWTTEIEKNANRYSLIKSYLEECQLPYFLDFEYVNGGLLVDGQPLDTMRMKWIDGLYLSAYINSNLQNKDLLNQLAADFLQMTNDFHFHKISHGDLQHENIFVDKNGNLKLIDYDSICVPNLEGERDITRGRPGYQHPSRLSAGYLASVKTDYFSELVIYLSILATAENPILWDKYKVMTSDHLLFAPESFLEFENSSIRADLMLLSENIIKLVKKMDSYLAAYLLISPLD